MVADMTSANEAEDLMFPTGQAEDAAQVAWVYS
jgi:hypothetical protein